MCLWDHTSTYPATLRSQLSEGRQSIVPAAVFAQFLSEGPKTDWVIIQSANKQR